MALSIEKIRATAERVAASHGLEIVDIEFLGSARQRVLRIFIEKNAAERARLAAEARQRRTHAASGEQHRAGEQDRADAQDAQDGEDAQDAQAGETAALLEHLGTQGIAMEQLAWITHADCELLSRDLGTVLDVEDLVPGAEYTLEVSSPGLDRALTTAAEFVRFRGSLVKVETAVPVAGNRHWQGRLVDADDRRIVLDLTAIKQKGKKKGTAAAAAGTIEIELGNVARARLIPQI